MHTHMHIHVHAHTRTHTHTHTHARTHTHTHTHANTHTHTHTHTQQGAIWLHKQQHTLSSSFSNEIHDAKVTYTHLNTAADTHHRVAAENTAKGRPSGHLLCAVERGAQVRCRTATLPFPATQQLDAPLFRTQPSSTHPAIATLRANCKCVATVQCGRHG